MKGRRFEYSPMELAWIQVWSDLPRRELHERFCATFGRTDVSQVNLTRLCTRNGWLTGRTGHFEKGNLPPNKGRKGQVAPGSEKGWFRAGQRRGRANENYKPIGTERISKDGYLERKIHDGMPLQSRWRAVHLIEWEKVNGPVPEGMCLKCLDGDRTNTDPANWEAIPRGVLARLAGKSGRDYDNAAPELKPTIMAVARLEHEARSRRGKDSGG